MGSIAASAIPGAKLDKSSTLPGRRRIAAPRRWVQPGDLPTCVRFPLTGCGLVELAKRPRATLSDTDRWSSPGFLILLIAARITYLILIAFGALMPFQPPLRFEPLQRPRHRSLSGVADHSLSFTLDTLDLLNCICTWGRRDAIQELVAARYETGSHGLSRRRMD
jgi:hypothetical protein